MASLNKACGICILTIPLHLEMGVNRMGCLLYTLLYNNYMETFYTVSLGNQGHAVPVPSTS